MLGRVLDAFQSRLNHLLGAAACRTLSDSPALAWQMALEPAATQLSNPAAFFSTLKGFEGIDAWVASIQQAGYAQGGETAEMDVFTHILQVTLWMRSAILLPALFSHYQSLPCPLMAKSPPPRFPSPHPHPDISKQARTHAGFQQADHA